MKLGPALAPALLAPVLLCSAAMAQTTTSFLTFDDLEGWAKDDHAAAMSVFQAAVPLETAVFQASTAALDRLVHLQESPEGGLADGVGMLSIAVLLLGVVFQLSMSPHRGYRPAGDER